MRTPPQYSLHSEPRPRSQTRSPLFNAGNKTLDADPTVEFIHVTLSVLEKMRFLNEFTLSSRSLVVFHAVTVLLVGAQEASKFIYTSCTCILNTLKLRLHGFPGTRLMFHVSVQIS